MSEERDRSRVNGPEAGAELAAAAMPEELDRERRKAEEHLRDVQRLAADFANYRRRSEADRDELMRHANAGLIRRLLEVLDSFDRALDTVPAELRRSAWVDGIWLVERQLRAILEAEGLRPIEAVGRPFDPREHEAVLHEESAEPEGTVTGELQKGYLLHDRVIRPALVKVAKATTTVAEE